MPQQLFSWWKNNLERKVKMKVSIYLHTIGHIFFVSLTVPHFIFIHNSNYNGVNFYPASALLDSRSKLLARSRAAFMDSCLPSVNCGSMGGVCSCAGVS
jgi:hypothetical protein